MKTKTQKGMIPEELQSKVKNPIKMKLTQENQLWRIKTEQRLCVHSFSKWTRSRNRKFLLSFLLLQTCLGGFDSGNQYFWGRSNHIEEDKDSAKYFNGIDKLTKSVYIY